jgi:hypothetical protein
MPIDRMQGFWSATPVDASCSAPTKKAFYIRMQICLTQKEFSKQREPFFVRFMTCAGDMAHLPIDQYRYVGHCMLETRFYFDEPEAFPVQSPMVCFDREDRGLDEAEEALGPMDLYGRLCTRAAVRRDKLELNFPDCRQMEMGFMGNELLLFLRLKGNFMVAVSSDSGVPIFMWDRRCLTPMDKANPVLGQGFKLTMPGLNGGAEHFWYERDRVQLFSSVRKVVNFAEAHIYKDGETRIDPLRHLLCFDIVKTSDVLRTQLRRLSRVVPYLKVATYSRVAHAIKVFVDLQWRCEVRWFVLKWSRKTLLNHFLQITLHINGTWRIVSMDPDPVVRGCNRAYLETLEANVRRALTRVCGGCKAPATRLRCCPCRAMYYCGRECQKAHWGEHRLVCGARGC